MALEDLFSSKLGELLEATTDDDGRFRRYRWASRSGTRVRQVEAEVGARGKAHILDIERPMKPGEIGPLVLQTLHDIRSLVAHESLHAPETVHPEPSGRRAIDSLAQIGASTDAARHLREELKARDRERVA